MPAVLQLKESNLLSYSESERKLIKILHSLRGKQIDTEKLTKRFYHGSVPFNGRTIISGCINSVIRKTNKNEEPFTIERSKRSGPISTKVWIVYDRVNGRA